MSKAEALTMLDDFANGDKTPVFRNANRATVADEMRKRVDNPSLINQGQSGTCGPASLVYDLLSRDPAVYVRAVQSLFDWGFAIIGKLTGSYWRAFAILRTGSTNTQRKRKLMIPDPVRP
jgi:hypothetical protein